MNPLLQEFMNDEFGMIRVIEEKGHIVVSGIDAARALGYARPSEAVHRHCRHAGKQFVAHPQNPDKKLEMLFIPEGDLYRLVVSSRLPAARRFEAWIYDELLPAVRVSGVEKLSQSHLADVLAEQTNILVNLKAEMTEQNDLARFARCIQMSEDNITLKKLTTLVQNIRLENGGRIETGRNRLMSWMRKNGYLCYSRREENIPTQRAAAIGLLEVSESPFEPRPGLVFLDQSTHVTPKGQAYFINLFIKKGLRVID